jgi:glycosyltransferase involved in cell wall biosynthesis
MPFAKDLTVIIPGYNEMFMRQTVESVLSHMQADTEVIAICDASWPDPVVQDHPRVKILHTTTSIGQRAATNVGAEISRAKYIMKLDAHCSIGDGFDVKMLAKMQPDMTMIPRMYRLHAFDWVCNECGHGIYQGSKPEKCGECGEDNLFMKLVWDKQEHKGASVSWRFDRELRMQYWYAHRRQPKVKEEIKSGIVETMSCVGCCFLMERERFFDLGGMDEGHGSWGQYGTELACKAWLSGGRMVTCVDTWFAHLFRTGNFAAGGESTFPYPINGKEQDAARDYSREYWYNNKHPKQVRPLSWLLEHFWPIPDWDDRALREQKKRGKSFQQGKDGRHDVSPHSPNHSRGAA